MRNAKAVIGALNGLIIGKLKRGKKLNIYGLDVNCQSCDQYRTQIRMRWFSALTVVTFNHIFLVHSHGKLPFAVKFDQANFPVILIFRTTCFAFNTILTIGFFWRGLVK